MSVAAIRTQLAGIMKPSVDSAGGHHLLKHTAPSIERVVECFDGAPVKEISKLIMRMGQRELQVGVCSQVLQFGLSGRIADFVIMILD